eukprot:augustus_masked-scaffold_69-processed-gene-0.67-mRNA-1 protein AED:0.39 eAED:1.00 QI:0/-1/0/1/-1/1/1/0/118
MLPGCPYKLYDLARACLSYEPSERITATEIVDYMVELMGELEKRRAKRVPSQVPPKDWVFDKNKGHYIPVESNIRRKKVDAKTKKHRREVRHRQRLISQNTGISAQTSMDSKISGQKM